MLGEIVDRVPPVAQLAGAAVDVAHARAVEVHALQPPMDFRVHVSNLSCGKYFESRASAVRACASMPSRREMRAVTGATSRFAARVMRCQVTVLMNLCTERPPE